MMIKIQILLAYIDHHWLLISMVWFPAFLTYCNATVLMFRAWGWTKLSDGLQKFEDGLVIFVQSIKNRGNPTNAPKNDA